MHRNGCPHDMDTINECITQLSTVASVLPATHEKEHQDEPTTVTTTYKTMSTTDIHIEGRDSSSVTDEDNNPGVDRKDNEPVKGRLDRDIDGGRSTSLDGSCTYITSETEMETSSVLQSQERGSTESSEDIIVKETEEVVDELGKYLDVIPHILFE